MGELEDLRGRTVGEFVLRERIDEGGFGAVYRCEQVLLGREAVVKVLHQRLRRNDVVLQRFMREAQLASRLDHPYAAHVYQFGIEPKDGLFWIAMEMVQGIALNRWLRERGPLPLDQLVPFFERVAEVVQTAHERGIVHRDLKPSNVMVIERAGRLIPKLLDFGIAKLLDDAALPGPRLGSPRPSSLEHDDTAAPNGNGCSLHPSEVATLTATTSPPPPGDKHLRLTHADATIGSPPYMSPEQWNDAVSVGPASDLYALGIVAFEALTGRRPFTAATIPEYIDLHSNAPVPPLGDGFSPALDRLFQRALAKRPEERWSTALELAAALRNASGMGGSSVDLPRLDDSVRTAWISDAPQPIAESIAALDGARNVHQARDAAQELVRNLLRYLLALATATHAQVRQDRDDPALLELVRTMRSRDLDEDERVRLLRLMVRPLVGRRGAHPVPELVDLVTPRPEDGTDGLDAIMALHPTSDHAGSEDLVRARLALLVPELSTLLRKLSFALDYALVVPRNDAPELWTGLRRQRRALATVHAGELVNHHPMLLDRERRICVDLWPLAQAVAPTEGAEPELFLFDGRGRHGARMLAAPAGYEHHDPSVWDWIAMRVIPEREPSAEARSDDRPPYLGLMAFSEDDAARFVGREVEVDSFLNRLRQRPLQVVVGPSGAGKTSFLRAGVIPGLPATWRTITLRPGPSPLAALAGRLAAAHLTTTNLRPLLETSPAAAAAHIASAAGGRTLVFVIDHLEELFTLCTDADERVRFAAVIAELAASADAPIRVVGAVRDDFLMDLNALPPLRRLLSQATVLLGNPSHDALVRIVVEPARRAGYALSDPDLAHDMVTAVADRPGALALLSFTASRLWELRDRSFRQLTRNAYEAMGGVAGALGRHAEETFAHLSTEEQRLARETLRHLVTADGVRALITRTELRQRLATPRADTVIDKLLDARLIAVSETWGEPHVEVIHDALIRAWPRLQQWIREDVEGLRMREQLRIAAGQWQDRVRSSSLLWRDDVLADLERWLRRSDSVSLCDLEREFVDASRRHARRASRVRRLLVLGAMGLLVAFGLYRYRALETGVAQRLAEARVTQSYVEQGRHALLDGKHTPALLFLREAIHRGEDSAGVRFMLARAAQPLASEVLRLPSSTGRMWSAIFSSDGQRIVTTDDRRAQVWEASTGRLLFSLPHSDAVFQAIYSPDGKTIFTIGADSVVKRWDAGTGNLLSSLSPPAGREQAFYTVGAISPDGRLVVALDARSGTATVWDVKTGDISAELHNEAAGASAVAFSQDGRWLATTAGGEARVFSTFTWKPACTLPVAAVQTLGFDPTGSRLVTGTSRGDVSVWSVPSGTRLLHLLDIGESIERVVFAPDGAFVAAARSDGMEMIWQSGSGQLRAKLRNHQRGITMIDFDRESRLLVSGSADGKLVVTDVDTGMPVSVFAGPGNRMTDAHFDPGSRRVLGASYDGTARVWELSAPYRRWTSEEIGRDCGTEVSLDQDGRFVAVNCAAHGTKVWDTALDRLLAELPGVTPVKGPFNGAFPSVSSAGDLAAIAIGNAVELYALPGGRRVATVQHAAPVTSVRFADRGRTLVTGSTDGVIAVTRGGGIARTFSVSSSGIDAAALLPDGRVVAADAGKRLVVIDVERGNVLSTLAMSARVRSLRISPDGRRLVTIPLTSAPSPPVLYDVDNGRVIAQLQSHKSRVFSAHFIRNGQEILTAGSDGTARLWNGMTGQLHRTLYGGTSSLVLDGALSPDGSMVVTAGDDGNLQFWDAASGAVLWTLRAHKAFVSGVHFEGNDIVTRSFTGQISRWHIPMPPPSSSLLQGVDRLTRCMPLRFDEATGALVQQSVSCGAMLEPLR